MAAVDRNGKDSHRFAGQHDGRSRQVRRVDRPHVSGSEAAHDGFGHTSRGARRRKNDWIDKVVLHSVKKCRFVSVSGYGVCCGWRLCGLSVEGPVSCRITVVPLAVLCFPGAVQNAFAALSSRYVACCRFPAACGCIPLVPGTFPALPCPLSSAAAPFRGGLRLPSVIFFFAVPLLSVSVERFLPNFRLLFPSVARLAHTCRHPVCVRFPVLQVFRRAGFFCRGCTVRARNRSKIMQFGRNCCMSADFYIFAQ